MRNISKRPSQIAAPDALSSQLLELLPDAVAVFNREGMLTESNQAFKQLFEAVPELTVTDISCQQFDMLLSKHAAMASQIPKIDYPAVIDSTTDKHALKHLIFLQNPGEHILERTLVFNASSDNTGGIMYFREVTSEYHIDQMKTEFLCTTAHELRAPMANIFGYTELLINNRFEADKQQDMLNVVYQETSRLLTILNDLLDLARIEARVKHSMNLQAESVHELLDEVIQEQQHILSEHTIILDGLTEQAVLCDKAKMKQVLINVLGNAAKYSSAGSIIAVRTSEQHKRHLPGVLIEITDQGLGMSEAQLKRVFERFYRGHCDVSSQGSGLGMTIVKEIVDLHEGEIRLSSILNKGTTVHLWLPSARHLATEEIDRR